MAHEGHRRFNGEDYYLYHWKAATNKQDALAIAKDYRRNGVGCCRVVERSVPWDRRKKEYDIYVRSEIAHRQKHPEKKR